MSFTLEMEAEEHSKTSVQFYQTKRRHIPAGSNLQPWSTPPSPPHPRPPAQQLKCSLGN